MLLAVLYFPVSGGRPALPVLSPAAISPLLTSLAFTAGPHVGPARAPGKYPFPTPTNPHVWHRLNEVHCTTALQDFLETSQWHAFAHTLAYNGFMDAHPACILVSR
jgi:hypothetical protein